MQFIVYGFIATESIENSIIAAIVFQFKTIITVYVGKYIQELWRLERPIIEKPPEAKLKDPAQLFFWFEKYRKLV